MNNFKIGQKVICIVNFNSEVVKFFNADSIKKDEILTITKLNIAADGQLCLFFKEKSTGTNLVGYVSKHFRLLSYINNITEIAKEFVEIKEKSDIEILEPVLN